MSLLSRLFLIIVALILPAFAARAADILGVGFSSNKPPYVIEAEARGIEVDIVVAAARAGGLAVAPQFAPMARLQRMLLEGKLDAMATTNPYENASAHYSAEYVEFQNYAVALAARKLEIKTISDLGKYSVSSFQRSSNLLGPEYSAMAAANPRYREEAEQITRNRLLFSGRIDVIIGDKRIIEHFNQEIAGQLDATQPLAWYPLFPPSRYRVAFRDKAQRDRFDAGLAAIRRSGEYAAILKRYAGR